MKLYQDYLELKEIFKKNPLNRKRDRQDALSWIEKSDFQKVLAWKKKYFPSKYKKASSYFSLGLTIVGFIFGFSLVSGLLLFYSGKEPVNILFFLGFVVVLPFFISLFSFLYNLLKPTLNGLILLKSTSIAGVFFSIGALVALLLIITTRDIAFGWATTLDISADKLYHFLNSFTLWDSFCSSCSIDINLIQKSHYVRATDDFITFKQDAILLGSWWKFLAMAIIFYGIIFRVLIYLATNILFKRVLKEEILKISKDLILNFNTPYIEYETKKENGSNNTNSDEFEQISSIDRLKDKELKIASYGFKDSEIEKLGLRVESIYRIGKRTFMEDEEFLEKNKDDILFIIRAYDAPILDILDLISDGMRVYLIGSKRDIDIWLRKFAEIGINPRVYV